MCATISYKATISVVNEISKHRSLPIEDWIKKGIPFNFVGDNVDKKKGVRDIRADFQGEMRRMYSMIAVRSRVIPHLSKSVSHHNLESLSTSMVLTTANDVAKSRRIWLGL